jgi:hypothetical protein
MALRDVGPSTHKHARTHAHTGKLRYNSITLMKFQTCKHMMEFVPLLIKERMRWAGHTVRIEKREMHVTI